ncbi:hypothetical protein [Enterobacter roggenkampii]
MKNHWGSVCLVFAILFMVSSKGDGMDAGLVWAGLVVMVLLMEVGLGTLDGGEGLVDGVAVSGILGIEGIASSASTFIECMKCDSIN